MERKRIAKSEDFGPAEAKGKEGMDILLLGPPLQRFLQRRKEISIQEIVA